MRYFKEYDYGIQNLGAEPIRMADQLVLCTSWKASMIGRIPAFSRIIDSSAAMNGIHGRWQMKFSLWQMA